MRRFYTLLLYLALPWVSLAVLLRGLRDREYWRGWGERFGHGPILPPGGVWVHAVSVGEVLAASILIEGLRAGAPDLPIVLTCATPTGRGRAVALGLSLSVSYAPYDLPGAVRRFLNRTQPSLLIVLETELWPNRLHAVHCAGIPAVLASARVSERTASRYRRFPGLLRDSLATNVWVGAQSEADAQRFAALGVPPPRLRVMGNIKFDRTVPAELRARGAALRERYAPGRSLWVAGSTHPGEEEAVLEAHQRLLQQFPDAMLVLAPRHPQRFDAVADRLGAGHLTYARRSQPTPGSSSPSVLLLDTLGELVDFYAACDAAFVGGSLVPIGGHNLLEPVAVGAPVLSGPHQFSSPQVAQALTQRHAVTIVHNAGELGDWLCRLLADPAERTRQSQAAQAVMNEHRGALFRLLELIDEVRTGSSTRAPTPS